MKTEAEIRAEGFRADLISVTNRISAIALTSLLVLGTVQEPVTYLDIVSPQESVDTDE